MSIQVRSLRLGDSGEDVARLQRNLARLGFDPGPVDGKLDHQTAAAIEQFQQHAGVEASGMVDSATRGALFRSLLALPTEHQAPPEGTPNTLLVKPIDDNLLVLKAEGSPRLVYSLDGWIELVQTDDRVEMGALRLRGVLHPDCTDAAPAELSLSAAAGGPAMARLDPETGLVAVSMSLEIDYPELADSHEPLVAGDEGLPPRILPLQTDVEISLRLDSERKEFTLFSFRLLDRLPPFFDGPVSLKLVLCGECQARVDCLDVCLSIKVGTLDGIPLLTAADIGKIVKAANDIWKPQCCIQFTAKEIVAPLDPALPLTVATDADLKKVLATNRSATCYNVYIVNKITYLGAVGLTQVSGKQRGSVVRASDAPDFDEIGQILAHEMGHALGLALGEGSDPEGVRAHSSREENLLFPSVEAGALELNAKQCDKARSSKLTRRTKVQCTPIPKEGPLV